MTFKMLKTGLFICMLGCFTAGLALAADTNSEIEKDKPETLNPDMGNDSLRSYVKEETAEKQANGDENKTWLNNLVNTVAEKGAQVISSGTDNNANMYRTNASVFDISGVMLRMNTKEVEAAMRKRSYQKNSEKYAIPNFIRWRYEELCRNNGVVGY